MLPDTAPPLPTSPTSLDISLTSQTILDSLITDDDPLDLLPTPTTDQADTNQPSDQTGFPRQPPQSEGGRQRFKKKRKTSHADMIHDNYAKVLQLVNSGTPASDAITATGTKKSTFYKWKPIAEIKIIDEAQFSNIMDQGREAADLLKDCKEILAEEMYSEIHKEMKKKGDLL